MCGIIVGPQIRSQVTHISQLMALQVEPLLGAGTLYAEYVDLQPAQTLFPSLTPLLPSVHVINSLKSHIIHFFPREDFPDSAYYIKVPATYFSPL